MDNDDWLDMYLERLLLEKIEITNIRDETQTLFN